MKEILFAIILLNHITLIMRHNALFLIYLSITGITTNAQLDQYKHFIKNNNQVIYVTTPSAASLKGNLLMYERKNKKGSWRLVDSFAITVGKNGIARDTSGRLQITEDLLIKKEGDGKSPAGIFRLGPVFSYNKLRKLKMPFQQVDTTDICVDDINSAYYNRLTNLDTVKNKDWNSFEYMKRMDDQYEYGIWVKYNNETYTPGRGSCIFLHIWKNENPPPRWLYTPTPKKKKYRGATVGKKKK